MAICRYVNEGGNAATRIIPRKTVRIVSDYLAGKDVKLFATDQPHGRRATSRAGSRMFPVRILQVDVVGMGQGATITNSMARPDGLNGQRFGKRRCHVVSKPWKR
jgi:hypothetical protein